MALTLTSFGAIADETNWITAAPQFREVDGQLYNTQKSIKFEPMVGTIVDVSGNVTVLRQEHLKVVDAYLRTANTIQYEDFVVTNFPVALQPTVGAQIYFQSRTNAVLAMRVGTINYNGQILKLYDYGTPHRVAVVTTNSIR